MNNDSDAMWRIVHIAHTPQNADAVEQLLREEGFLVRRRALSGIIAGSGLFEIYALKSEAKEARDILTEHGL